MAMRLGMTMDTSFWYVFRTNTAFLSERPSGLVVEIKAEPGCGCLLLQVTLRITLKAAKVLFFADEDMGYRQNLSCFARVWSGGRDSFIYQPGGWTGDMQDADSHYSGS